MESKLEALDMYETAIEKAQEETYAEEDEETQQEMTAVIKQFQEKVEELRATFTGDTVAVSVDMVVPDDCVAGDVVEVELQVSVRRGDRGASKWRLSDEYDLLTVA